MSKTNFKCMFLIDDKLYNKAILQEGVNENTNVKGLIPNSSYLTSIPSSQQIKIVEPEGNMNTHAEFRNINELGKVDNAQQVKIKCSDEEQQAQTPAASTSSANTTSLEIPGNDDMEIDQNKNENEDCECNEILPKASSSRKSQADDNKRKSARSDKKLTVRKPLSGQAKRRMSDEDDDLSDDSDWEDLKQRYRRLRGDFDSPPRKKSNFKHFSEGEKADNNISSNKNSSSTLMDRKKDSSIAKFESVSYICSICKQTFRRRNALHRHIMNWHSEYFEEPSIQKKRKRSDQDTKDNKKFRSDGRKKRNMPQNQTRYKIPRTEFPCAFCQRFFKTKSTLERHNSSIHGIDRGNKRSNNANETRYVKRQKANGGAAVTYLNYF